MPEETTTEDKVSEKDFKTEYIVLFPGLGGAKITEDGIANQELTTAEGPLMETNFIGVKLKESLLTPSLQTSILVESRSDQYYKDLDVFYGQDVYVRLHRRAFSILYENAQDKVETTQQIYKITDRKRVNRNMETYTMHACDHSLIRNWSVFAGINETSCAPPSQIFEKIIRNCVHSRTIETEGTGPPQYFSPDNLRPFAAINRLAERSYPTAKGEDPSMVHFMRYQKQNGESDPTHNFRSLYSMAQQNSIWKYTDGDRVSAQANFHNLNFVQDYSFPCDWDLLSDVMNDIGLEGETLSALNIFNETDASFQLVTKNPNLGFYQCGTAPDTAYEEDKPCSVENAFWMKKRKARMALLDQRAIQLKMLVTFNPNLNVGRTIDVWFNKREEENGAVTDFAQYGSGRYLIVNMTHDVKMDGLGTTTLDCVSQSVARGKI